MQRIEGRLVFSPSDLNHFLECEHLLQLQRRADARELARPRDAQADLLARKGLEHERAWFDRFVVEGRDVVSVAADGGERNWAADAVRTVAAMRAGVEIIYQSVFEDGDWHGIGDFLVRVDKPSALGAWSYEAWDTKLARQAKPYFALQLCAYSEHLARIQGTEPEFMRVVLGTGHVDALRYRDFASYYRNIRARFLEAASVDRETYPRPVSHCGLCEFSDYCDARWRQDQHLSLVYGLSRSQVERLNEAGVLTVADLAAIDPVARVGIGPQTLHRLRHQATLQTHFRQTGSHKFELLPPTPENGFRLLPAPSEGDIFFDMEGYPYFEPASGLEYLFGLVTEDGRFHAWHASNHAEEKKAFEDFLDFVHDRLTTWPDLHVYHYAAYEPSTLKRLMSVHATREDALDDLLRREVFVDLYQVVRQAIRHSHASYSIKKVRTFFMPDAGHGAVTDGGESILEFERYLETRDEAILDAITRYNEEDCVSTVRLRDWLLEQRKVLESTFGVALPWKTSEPLKENPKRVEVDALTESRRARLEAMGTPSATLMANLLGYHRREAKPEWWAYFERQSKSQDELLDDVESLAFVELDTTAAPVAAKKSWIHTFRFPQQETKIRPEMKVRDPFNDCAAGEVVEMDAGAGWITLLRGPSLSSKPAPTALVPDKPLDSSAQRAAVGRVADALLAGEAESAVLDILHNQVPRFDEAYARSVRLQVDRDPASIQTVDLEAQKRLVAALDNSYLFIQGPPGSGKTYTGGRLIVSLLREGKRIGVAAHAHKAIHNLLNEVVAVAREEGVTFRGVKKSSGSEDTEFHHDFFENIDDPKVCDASDADLIAGTSWQFAREAMEQTLDYLFIDEAGQISLADAVAMGTSARNVVLLGDPQQLPHVSQGVHPGGSGRSVLEHLLDDAATVSPDRGVFLASSWRMHPEVCSFVSELSYDRRLTAAPERERQVIASGGLAGAGLRFVPVTHANNGQQSHEEAAAIAEQVKLLLQAGTFTDVAGNTRPLEPPDILVVSPYNMQVRLLADRMPAGVEVGTVHKFQGREAPIVFFSMASSSGEDVPRGLDFLFSRNSLNVAVSRARAMAVLVCSPRLLEVRCATLDQMRLVNNLCRFVEASL
ncbi:MAG: TM0106 family RecB-like putative nuclease [Acidobacteria bacterium]|nr:TM0106 family RecB-like putative nuclease [Acidobacteriota bacterium]